MVGKSKSRTKAQQRRFDALKEMGCILCLEQGFGWCFAEIHHILDGGKRMGHDYTIPLNVWYHKGDPMFGMNERGTKALLGPSMKLHKREFVDRFGTEMQILDRVNERLEGKAAADELTRQAQELDMGY